MDRNENETNRLNDIKTFYEFTYYKGLKPRNSPPSHHLRLLARKIDIQKDDHVLDVACGSGEWLSACKERGASIFGIDLSEKVIEACQMAFDTGVFYSSPAESLHFEDNKFDIVTCLGSLEHFVNPVKALKEMKRVAKKDALFLILVPNKDFLTRKLGLFLGTKQVDAKEDVKTLGEWNALFEESGLIVKERWKDLHVLSWRWISSSSWYSMPIRAAQALALTLWPLKWQYQVYHLCKARPDLINHPNHKKN
jgi:SAM-dependent methyltransferase